MFSAYSSLHIYITRRGVEGESGVEGYSEGIRRNQKGERGVIEKRRMTKQSLMGSNSMCAFSSGSRNSNARSTSSGGGSSSANISEIGEGVVEELVSLSTSGISTPSHDVEGKMFVAVGNETRDGMSTLVWVVRNNPTLKKLVLVHVHRPSSLIPMMGGWFRPSQLTVQQVNLHRQRERKKTNMILDEYESFCMKLKVQVERLVIEMDNIAKGLVDLIAQNGITKFVMGAAADKNYSKKMKVPRSKTASTVQREAPLSCKIWFVCNQILIHTREANVYGVVSPMESPSTTPSRASISISSENYHDETTSSDIYTMNDEDGSQLVQEPVDDPQVSCSEKQLPQDGISGKMYYNEVKHKNEMEVTLESEKLQVEQLKQLQIVHLEELDNAQRQRSSLERQITESSRVVKDLEDKLLSARCFINSLQNEINNLVKERENAASGAKELQQNREEIISSGPSYFSYSDLEQATRKFESSSIIGAGGYGRVHKGYLRCTQVAIKLLDPDSLQGKPEFYQEVDILVRVRHPNLVTLIGTCPEACALVYEFLPNGSLEDRLKRSPPLSWQVRTRISYEVCCAIVFLHSAKPFGIVHGDLKPANILLDANLVSKLSDFGISRFLIESATKQFHMTSPKGTFAYMDPEFMLTGELTPQSDVYSLGIILLRLLTGRPAMTIVKVVKEAMDKGKLEMMIDPTAGNWPLHQAHQLAQLGIRCCEMKRKNRPNLVHEVWRLLDQMNNSSLSSLSSSLKEADSGIPPYFICPIYQEIMKDPYVAADGYTYEAEAIKTWLKSGNKISAKTKLKLSHEHLLPNHSLRAAIEDWQRRSHA